MTDARTRYDVIIIGSGAGGATIANELAPTGKKILILERGDHLQRSPDNWNSTYVFVDRKYRTNERWYDREGKPFHPNTHYWVGGNTTFYGAALFRLRPGDFEERLHPGGVSPAWPISYIDLAPYYTRAEKKWQVHGKRGVDPTEPGGEADYDFPPLRHDPTVANLEKHFQGLGWHPSPMPLGIHRDDADPEKSACIRCGTCGGYPCLVLAKSDARTMALGPIEGASNVTLIANAKALRLDTNAAGTTVTKVQVEQDGELTFYEGDLIVLAAGAVNTAAILLNSNNPGHENGLANASDQVGRNYMFHTMSAVVSVAPAPVQAFFPKTLYVNDFYWKDPEGGFDWPMGHFQLLERMEGHVLEGQIEAEGVSPFLIPDFVSDGLADRMLAFLVLSEDLPSPRNRVRWDGDKLRLEYWRGSLDGHNRLVGKLDKAMDSFDDGGHAFTRHHFQFTKMLPLYGTAHMCGTTRMGRDPKSSVVDADCKAHQLDNLYVTDASVFVSSAAVNPTLTIVANAMRVAERLKERLGA